MSAHTTTNFNFNAAANALEGMRQTSVASAATQAAVISAEIVYYRALYKLALSSSISTSNFVQALHSLGVKS
jgi:hypothetical protein